VADFQRDDLEGFAPTRRIDRGAGPHAARPEWLTANGESEAKGMPAGIDRPAVAREPARPRPVEPERPAGDSWENAVERVEGVTPGPEPTIRFDRKWSMPRIPGLESVLGVLSRSQPLVFVALAVIAVVALMMFRPREEQTVSIAAIHRHPERFEGRPVKVRGRVGDVYEVGGGYAFYLRQGRDDIVVFTRSRVPVRREEVTIAGSISTGVLDGKSRQALFETAH
jgi:hypothetical protein